MVHWADVGNTKLSIHTQSATEVTATWRQGDWLCHLWTKRTNFKLHCSPPSFKWAIRKLMHYFTCTKSFKHPLILKVYPRVWAVEEKFCSHQAEFSRKEDLHSFWVTINLNTPSNALMYDSITILKIRAFLNKHTHTLCRLFKIKK